ncbi:unnamed protein product [Brassicogethes aeneus]|uniref:Uncharacterized protein n=1 Tax=Brassicogethes aeneus TaxID=1431903 RepID=A0A9P0AS57_BRAAE|nr:unnamed protein product [Brassicogethes aeneus]
MAAEVDLNFLGATLARLNKEDLVSIILSRQVEMESVPKMSEATVEKLKQMVKSHLLPKTTEVLSIEEHSNKQTDKTKELLEKMVSQLESRITEQSNIIKHFVETNKQQQSEVKSTYKSILTKKDKAKVENSKSNEEINQSSKSFNTHGDLKEQQNANLKEIEKQQSELAQSIINLTKPDQKTEISHKKYTKRFGTEKVEEKNKETGFVGADRKAWLYIYNVKNHVSTDMIKKYLKDKLQMDLNLIECYNIDGDSNKPKRFKVGAPMDKKDQLYQNSFWPEGVGIKRFRFNKNSEKPPANFL